MNWTSDVFQFHSRSLPIFEICRSLGKNSQCLWNINIIPWKARTNDFNSLKNLPRSLRLPVRFFLCIATRSWIKTSISSRVERLLVAHVIDNAKHNNAEELSLSSAWARKRQDTFLLLSEIVTFWMMSYSSQVLIFRKALRRFALSVRYYSWQRIQLASPLFFWNKRLLSFFRPHNLRRFALSARHYSWRRIERAFFFSLKHEIAKLFPSTQFATEIPLASATLKENPNITKPWRLREPPTN